MTKEKTPAGVIAAIGKAINDSRAPWVVLALLGLALILGGCSLDRERVAKTREDLVVLCQGALTIPLQLACERAGVDTAPQPATN